MSPNTVTKKAETFPASSPTSPTSPDIFHLSLSWVRWSNNSCLSCRWRILHQEDYIEGFVHVFFSPWSASVGEHNGLVLSCQAQGHITGVACRHFQWINNLNVLEKRCIIHEWAPPSSVSRVCVFSGCFYAFNEALHYKMQKFWMTIWVVEVLKKRGKKMVSIIFFNQKPSLHYTAKGNLVIRLVNWRQSKRSSYLGILDSSPCSSVWMWSLQISFRDTRAAAGWGEASVAHSNHSSDQLPWKPRGSSPQKDWKARFIIKYLDKI